MKRPEDTVIASNYAALILRLTRAREIRDENVLAQTGIRAEQLEGEITSINGKQFLQMIRNVSELVDDSAFPVYYGMNMSVATHGIMGYALLTCASARDAFSLALRYYRTVFSMLSIVEESHGENVHFVFDFDICTGEMEKFMIEGVFAGLLSVSRYVLGIAEIPCEMRYTGSRPSHVSIYQTLFGLKPTFDCERNEIIVSRSVLDLALPAHDPQTQRLAQAQCEKALESMAEQTSFPDRIKQLIKSNPNPLPSLSQVADRLHMHPRTLGRRLSDFDTCFKDLLEEVKSELAMEYLANSDLLIDDIAYSLNYNDATSFYRAFRRWTGRSPGMYRQKHARTRLRAV
ncbi:AraC-type DNA-binding domain-containing proteins [gamma proteobacterium HdN1]|nr:AraC-type DNA-binding domain-containing proteins [gamma proteobacterium HdN1]